jgi:hypothetical protein
MASFPKVLDNAFYNYINYISQDLLGSLILADKNTLNDWDPPFPIKNDQRRNRAICQPLVISYTKLQKFILTRVNLFGSYIKLRQ